MINNLLNNYKNIPNNNPIQNIFHSPKQSETTITVVDNQSSNLAYK